MFYTSEPEACRAFIRDKLGFPATDVGDGWLIFDLPEADMGVHPADPGGQHGSPSGTHDISFYCDDLAGTMKELKAKGVEFVGDVAEAGYAKVAYFLMPGPFKVQLYEPYYKKG